MRKKINGNVVKGSKLWEMAGFMDFSNTSSSNAPIILRSNKENISEKEVQPQRYTTWQLSLVDVELGEARKYFDVDSKAEGHSFEVKTQYQNERNDHPVIADIEEKLNTLDKYSQK